MNTAAKLRFQAWQKPETVFEVRGWSSRKGLAFVLDAQGRRRVLRFVLPGLLTKSGLGACVEFPRAVPTAITETCLLPPPCRTTEAEAECLRAAATEAALPNGRKQPRQASDFPDWEQVWLRYRDEILLPTPADETALAAGLETFKAQQRQEYEARKRELEDWRTKMIGQMILLGGGCYYRELRDCKPDSIPEQVKRHVDLLEFLFTRPLSESLGRLHGGYLNWTLEVARHEARIRDPVLRERWAREHHLNLAEMDAEKKAFLDWYRAMVPAPSEPAHKDLFIMPGIRAGMADRALCAEVRFVACFADGARVWLADCAQRDPLLTPEEQREFEALDPIPAPRGRPTSSPAIPAEEISATLAAAKALTEAGQQARAHAEAGAATLGARTKDLEVTLGKVPETFADPLVAAARDAAIRRGVPELFAWWAFQEHRVGKFPTTDGAFKRCGLGPQLKQAGVPFSRPTVGRWVKVIREELEQRGLLQKRSLGVGAIKARDYDVEQAKDLAPFPGSPDEPPEIFVQWVEDRDAAGDMPTVEDVMEYVRTHAGASASTSLSPGNLRPIAERWLKAAIAILDSAEPGSLGLDADDAPQDGA